MTRWLVCPVSVVLSLVVFGVLPSVSVARPAAEPPTAVAAAERARFPEVGHQKRSTGQLTVRVVGLPAGHRVVGRVRGPGVRRRMTSQRLRIGAARPGVYRLSLSRLQLTRSAGTIKRGAIAVPTPRSIKVRVRAGKRARLTGRYGTIINPQVRSVRGGVVEVHGDPGDPTAVVFRGRRTFVEGAVLSAPPSRLLPRGLLSHVDAESYASGRTTVRVRAASAYAVAPSLEFDIPLEANEEASVARRAASCAGTAGLSPYRNIKNISVVGGWRTSGLLGPVELQARLRFTVEAGVKADASFGITCSIKKSLSANGMAGPIPVTAAIEGELSASISAGAKLSAGGSVRVEAGARASGRLSHLTWDPEVKFEHPRFAFSAQRFAEVRAGFGVNARIGIGNDNLASATVGIGSGLEFTGRPGACSFDASFGSFFAQGSLLGFRIDSPRTPPLFSRNLWRSACRATGAGGGPGSGGADGSGDGSAGEDGSGSDGPGEPTGVANGGGAIENPAAGRCLDVPGATTRAGTELQIFDCNGSAAQQWRFVDGALQVYANACLDVRGGALVSGTAVQVWQCNGTQAQRWSIEADGSIKTPNGLCLDVAGAGKANGSRVQVFTCNGSDAQRWTRP